MSIMLQLTSMHKRIYYTQLATDTRFYCSLSFKYQHDLYLEHLARIRAFDVVGVTGDPPLLILALDPQSVPAARAMLRHRLTHEPHENRQLDEQSHGKKSTVESPHREKKNRKEVAETTPSLICFPPPTINIV